MPKITQQIHGKVGIRTQGQTLASHPGLIPQFLTAAPNPWGTFIYRIPLAMRGVPELPSSPLHSRKLPSCWRPNSQGWMSTDKGALVATPVLGRGLDAPSPRHRACPSDLPSPAAELLWRACP